MGQVKRASQGQARLCGSHSGLPHAPLTVTPTGLYSLLRLPYSVAFMDVLWPSSRPLVFLGRRNMLGGG